MALWNIQCVLIHVVLPMRHKKTVFLIAILQLNIVFSINQIWQACHVCFFLGQGESILDSTMAIIIIIYRLCYYGLESYILWGLNLSLNVGVLDHKISRICLYSCSDRYYWVVFLNMVLSYALSGRLVTCYELGDKNVIFIEPDTIAFITSLLYPIVWFAYRIWVTATVDMHLSVELEVIFSFFHLFLCYVMYKRKWERKQGGGLVE